MTTEWGPDWEEFRVREARKRLHREKLRNAQARLRATARTMEQKHPPKPDLDIRDGLSPEARELGIRSYQGPRMVVPGKGEARYSTVRLPYLPFQHIQDG